MHLIRPFGKKLLWVALLPFSFVAANLSADSEIQLSGERQSHLVSLAPVMGDSLETQNLDDKSVVVTFFASWCPPCRKEFEVLNTLRDEFSTDELTIVAVNVFEDFNDDDETRLRQFLSDTAPEFHVVIGTEETKQQFGNINRIPTLFVFDSQGQLAMHFIHHRGASKSTAKIDELRDAITATLDSGA